MGFSIVEKVKDEKSRIIITVAIYIIIRENILRPIKPAMRNPKAKNTG